MAFCLNPKHKKFEDEEFKFELLMAIFDIEHEVNLLTELTFPKKLWGEIKYAFVHNSYGAIRNHFSKLRKRQYLKQ